MKNKIKKIIIAFVIVALILTGILIYRNINVKNNKLTKEELNEIVENTKVLRVKYLVMEKNDDEYTFDNVFPDHFDDYLSFAQEYIFLSKKGNYYVSTLKNDINQKILDSVTDVDFALNNTNGELIDDCIYDKKTNEVKIPKEYFEKEYDNVGVETPIQMELLSRLSDKEIKKLSINVNTKNIFSKNKTVLKNGKNDTFTLATQKNKKNIDIYLNNSTVKLEEQYYSYDKKTGTITFDINPMLVSNIKVDYSNDNILNMFNASAYTLNKHNSIGVITLNSAPANTPVVSKLNGSVRLYTAKSRSDKYNNATIYVNPMIPDSTFAELNATQVWYALNDSNFNREAGSTVDDVIEINPKTTFGYDYDQTILFGANCIHIAVRDDFTNFGGVSGTYTFNWRISNVTEADSEGYITFSVIFMLDPGAEWSGTETSGIGQTLVGILKFRYQDSRAQINVNKKLTDNGTDVTNSFDKTGIEFGLYSDSSCSNKITSGKTDSNGVATFSDLTLGTYYVKETSLGNLNPDEWEMDTSDNPCKKVIVSNDSTKVGNYYVASVNVTNKKKKYCVKLIKKDVYSGQNLSGINFKLSNATTGVEAGKLATNNNGEVVFSNLDYSPNGYWIVEDSGNSSITSPSNTKVKYWNDNGTPTTKKLDLNASLMVNGTCPATPTTYIFNDKPVYYCLKIKKVDRATGEALTGATFTATLGSNSYTAKTDNSGIATFMVGTNEGTYTVTETASPEGYALPANATKQVAATTMSQNTTKDQSTQIGYCNAEVNDAVTYTDSKYLLNWYKDTENKAPAKDAKFKVSIGEESNKKYVKVEGKQNQTDANGVTKSCYVYAGLTSNENEASTLLSDTNGEVCISRVSKGTYTVTETNPSKYHTFGKNANKKINATTVFSIKDSSEDSANNTNRFVNYDTEFEFTKTVSSGDEEDIKIIINGKEKTLKDLTTEELMKLEFNVYDSNNNLVSFILKDGIYEYSENDIDGNAGDKLTGLHLDNTRKIKIHHLPVGTYSIKEKNSNTCEASSNYSECVGYYYPEYKEESSYKFTINNCSNSNASACGNGKYEISKQQLENKPTEITFTKKDYYSYYDAADKNKSDENVDFVDAKERNDFDKIVFKLKDENGKYLTLKKVRDVGDCTSDSSYSEYRYVSSDQTDSNGTELHACGGHIKITNLCRGKKYTMEEISVPEGSVYVKENTTNTPTSVEYKIPCTSGDTTHNSTTNIIKDKPTRVRFEKRDSKYNYLINDETTTFEVYKCKKNEKCHPGNYTTKEEREKNGMTLVKFSKRAVIAGDEEDSNDEAGLSGVEVYKKISDSDVKKGASYVTELHPYNGILVLRYLEADYNYVLLETVAPKNYTLPEGVNAETSFTVTSTTVKVDEVDVPNKPTSLLIRKYSDDGELLEGAEFKVYEGTTCDANLSAMNQPKTLLKLKTIRDGVYENRPEKDTDTIKTCTDREDAKCSDIPVNDITKLTYIKYLGTWSEFENTENTKNEKVEIKQGEALIQYLEYGHCYIIEEVKAPKGYSLPKKDEDRYTMVTIEANKDYIADTYKELVNKPTPFTFYKYDEYNKLLDGAEFKLQKLDDNKKYHDVTVTKEETENGFYYKVDSNTTNTKIETKNGSATVYYLEEGQYRIVETKAAPGKELNKNPNVATFFVDGSGNVYGNSIIVNKGKTEKIEIKSSSSAELIVSIQTGQTVIKYGLIISILVALISLLMILKKKAK